MKDANPSRERPILFSAPMVRAILAGRKTQTRRVVNPQPPDAVKRADLVLHPAGGRSAIVWCSNDYIDPLNGTEFDGSYKARNPHGWRCPYGQPGDRLWVRETWRIGAWDCDTGGIAVDYKADDHHRREWIAIPGDDVGETFNRYWQQSCEDCEAAGLEETEGGWKWEPGQSPCRWRPSIHMPRWASRILLEITRVRVERLKNISPDDCIAEGAWSIENREIGRGHEAVEAFRSLWESINGDGSWAANPWVWVVEFRRVGA